MLVLGIQGSPRSKGNTKYLLSLFMEEAEKLGAETVIIEAAKKNIKPCMEYLACEKKGLCPINDEMDTEVIPLLRKADAIIIATPMFFYSCSAQLKTLIDRTQALWARKYRLKLTDPMRKWRKGFMLALGATKGKNLFEGMIFTAKYFYDAVGAKFEGSLTYREVENPGDMEKHPTVHEDVKTAVRNLLTPLLSRKKILFLSKDDSAEGQMASAFTQLYAGDIVEAHSFAKIQGGRIDPVMKEAMHEKGIDMEYRNPAGINDLSFGKSFNMLIFINGKDDEINIDCNNKISWDFPFMTGKPIKEMREARDKIEEKVKELINSFKV